MKNYLFPFSFLLLSLGIQAEKPQWGIPDTISHYRSRSCVYSYRVYTKADTVTSNYIGFE